MNILGRSDKFLLKSIANHYKISYIDTDNWWYIPDVIEFPLSMAYTISYNGEIISNQKNDTIVPELYESSLLNLIANIEKIELLLPDKDRYSMLIQNLNKVGLVYLRKEEKQ